MEKKLNGFNNGRNIIDGVGGREPFTDWDLTSDADNTKPEKSCLTCSHFRKKLGNKIIGYCNMISLYVKSDTGIEITNASDFSCSKYNG